MSSLVIFVLIMQTLALVLIGLLIWGNKEALHRIEWFFGRTARHHPKVSIPILRETWNMEVVDSYSTARPRFIEPSEISFAETVAVLPNRKIGPWTIFSNVGTRGAGAAPPSEGTIIRALHPRLGAKSPASILGWGILRDIVVLASGRSRDSFWIRYADDYLVATSTVLATTEVESGDVHLRQFLGWKDVEYLTDIGDHLRGTASGSAGIGPLMVRIRESIRDRDCIAVLRPDTLEILSSVAMAGAAAFDYPLLLCYRGMMPSPDGSSIVGAPIYTVCVWNCDTLECAVLDGVAIRDPWMVSSVLAGEGFVVVNRLSGELGSQQDITGVVVTLPWKAISSERLQVFDMVYDTQRISLSQTHRTDEYFVPWDGAPDDFIYLSAHSRTSDRANVRLPCDVTLKICGEIAWEKKIYTCHSSDVVPVLHMTDGRMFTHSTVVFSPTYDRAVIRLYRNGVTEAAYHVDIPVSIRIRVSEIVTQFIKKIEID